MTSFGPISGQPIGDNGTPTPTVPPVAGQVPGSLSRFLLAKYPPISVIRGQLRRALGVATDDFIPVAGTPINKFRRFLESKHPPYGQTTASWLWRFGYPQPPVFTIVPTRRFLKSNHPPFNQVKGRFRRSGAVDPLYLEFLQTYQQAFRVADNSLNLYELFLGEDAPVDFGATGQPVASSLTLPFSYTPTPPGAGEKILNIVVRKTNAYGIQSFNVFETARSINAGGGEVLVDPSPPENLILYDAQTGALRVIVSYPSVDDTDPADEFEIYAEIGVDPVPGTDVPAVTQTMIVIGAEAGLSEIISGFTPGDVIHVIATALRTSDGARGNSAVVQITLALPLDLADGQMFGGNAYEQR